MCPSAADDAGTAGNPAQVADFSLTDLDGRTHRLSEYLGRVVLVTFWATWCPECVIEMPSLQSLSNSLPDDRFTVLAINVGEEKHVVQSFAERNNLNFPLLLDHDLEVYKQWPVLGVPTSFLIDRQGKVSYSVVGAVEWTHPERLSRIRDLHVLDQE